MLILQLSIKTVALPDFPEDEYRAIQQQYFLNCERSKAEALHDELRDYFNKTFGDKFKVSLLEVD